MSKKETNKTVTIKQVAEHAGVSIGTVSNFLNSTLPVSKKTAERITKSIEELNYVPNAMASSLRRKTSRMIDVLVPNMNNSFYAGVLRPFTNLANKKNYNVRIFGYDYSADLENRMLKSMENSRPGVAVVFSGLDDEKQIKSLIKKDIPVVLADRDTDIPGVPFISFDNEHVFDEIVEELSNRGYRKIGLFIEPPHLANIKKRYDNCLAALKRHGFPTGKSVVFSREDFCEDHLKNSYRFMKDLLKRRKRESLPDVWITSSDLLAIGLIRALHEKGYSVPEDFGVIGFDNIEVAGYVHPRLSTVDQNQEALGKELWKMVEKVLNNEEDIENITLPQRLVLRESV